MCIWQKIPILFVTTLAWIVIISSCANIGSPTGGPKDTIPPELVETKPEYKALNFNGDDIRLTFNEYIATDAISEDLVISPPLDKRPIIRTKSKTLIIGFNEELKDSTTYSLDFKNSIADNNEKNPYKNMRFSFSTGPVYDSLRVAGRVMNAFNMEPQEKTLVLLHRNLHDSAVFKVQPDYIAKTDENGIFLIDNIAPGKYHLFSINDANNNLKYDEGAEEIAFIDSLIVPSAEFIAEPDTLVSGVDSMLIYGHTQFHPTPFYLHQFTEDIFDQYLDKNERNAREKIVLTFNESVKDTFAINLVNQVPQIEDWYVLEPNENQDSLVLWIADSTIAKTDTLLMEIAYSQMDSSKNLFVHKDTLDMIFTDKAESNSRKKKKGKEQEEEKPQPVPQFNWSINTKSSTVELNQSIKIQSPEPVAFFDTTKVRLYLTEDTLKTPLHFNISEDTTAWRTYLVHYAWVPETNYTLEIDSAASINIFGITSKKLAKKFSTREEDYYGKYELVFSNVEMPMLVQLVKNNDKESVIAERKFSKNGTVVFDYVKPEKYKVKLIFDRNGNGKWDTGSYQDKYQPERVTYINEVIKIRSNWESSYNWMLTSENTFVKKIRDLEVEEQKRKEAEEKARKERERENQPQQMQNVIQQGGGMNSSRF
ncbi:MAG: hypothetical protein CSA36_07990 [Draconibacterium sp.]|nr:MAG: hypothetical protein CSA36_07990 [Draconibacterium sp.]